MDTILIEYKQNRTNSLIPYPIIINTKINRIQVKQDEYFDEALHLAKKYEEELKEEFTVKKNYMS